MKKLLFSFLLFSVSLLGQPRDKFPAFLPIVPFETQVVSFPRTDGDFTIDYTYKIPYRLMVFERQGESFKASFRIMIEITDKTGKLVARDIKDSKLSVHNFEDTNAPTLFLQDYLSFKVVKNDYKVRATISDMNSSGDRQLKSIDVNLISEDSSAVLNPLVVDKKMVNCEKDDSLMLTNSAGHIPFSMNMYDLIIPITDTTISQIEVSLENNGEDLPTISLDDSYIEQLGISKCEDELFITNSTDHLITRNFLLRNVNKKLNEGDLVLTVRNKDKEINKKINMQVVWFNKPISLLNLEKAIEFLSIIAPDSVVDELLSADEEEYPKVLNDYWKKFDPTPETSFNEIMFEFYNRVDYAIKEYKSITNNNGAKSDRGVVYIRFGKPDKIDRTSTSQGEVIEIWTYSNPQRKFTFVDKIGTGNFTLTENQ